MLETLPNFVGMSYKKKTSSFCLRKILKLAEHRPSIAEASLKSANEISDATYSVRRNENRPIEDPVSQISTASQNGEILSRLAKDIEKLVKIREKEAKKCQYAEEWKFAATVFDRMCGIAFITILSVTIIVTLITLMSELD